MKKWILFIIAGLLFISCKKDGFDTNNPDVKKFVKQLKNGTYNEYERNEKGERLWLKMPKFRPEHIATFIELSKDTAHIQKFPTNPVSSRTPIPSGRDYFILGECLLWIAEGLRPGGTMSLDPYLVDTSKEVTEMHKGVTTTEILMISDKYRQWWNSYKKGNKNANAPLEGTPYLWM